MMLEKVKTALSEKWTWIVGAFVVLVSLLTLERYRRKSAESNLEQAETNKESAVLDSKRESVAEDIKRVEQEETKVISDAEAKKAAAEEADLHDIEAYYNKKHD